LDPALGGSEKTRPTRLSEGGWLAAAAAIALAVALGGYAGQLRSRIGTLESRLREAMLRADASERQVADVRRTAFEAQSAVAVLTAPDVARIELAGQPVAPRASARAFWSRSRGMVFTASNLPPLPAGRTYQLWVVTAQPAPTSVGLLKPDASGRADARFETPPDIPQPVALAVTIEPEGGVPAPTGDKYLIGLAH
jgi:anti-sigma-K factor RskA